jgi:hypothetical protein
MLCLKAKTRKSHEIHEYYVNLEEIMNNLVSEETEELKRKLQIVTTVASEESQELKNKLKIVTKEGNDILIKNHNAIKLGTRSSF